MITSDQTKSSSIIVRLLSIILILPLTFTLASCSDDDDDNDARSNNESIIGSWFYETKALDIYAQFTDKEFYFEIETEYDQIDVFGTYTYEGNIFRVTYRQSYDETDLFKKGDTYLITRKGDQITICINGDYYSLELDDADYGYL